MLLEHQLVPRRAGRRLRRLRADRKARLHRARLRRELVRAPLGRLESLLQLTTLVGRKGQSGHGLGGRLGGLGGLLRGAKRLVKLRDLVLELPLAPSRHRARLRGRLCRRPPLAGFSHRRRAKLARVVELAAQPRRLGLRLRGQMSRALRRDARPVQCCLFLGQLKFESVRTLTRACRRRHRRRRARRAAVGRRRARPLVAISTLHRGAAHARHG